MKGKGLQREKELLQSKKSVFIKKMAIIVELKRRMNDIKEELRFVDEMKIKEDSNITKMSLASSTT